MAELTTTRLAVRRGIGRMARLEFFMRYGDTGQILSDSDASTSTPVVIFADAGLVQDTDFWRGDWLYDITLGEERLILNSSSDGAVNPEYGFSVVSSSDDPFEIWSMWPPSHVHFAINQANRAAWKYFPNVVLSEQHVIVQDRLRYGLNSSDFIQSTDDVDVYPTPASILQIWIETSRNATFGQVTTFTSANLFSDTNTTPNTSADSDFLLSFYDGPGAGEVREVTSVTSGGEYKTDTDFIATLTTDSKFTMWNPSSGQFDDWYPLFAARFDQIENPSEIFLTQNYVGAYGLRMRLIYLAQSTDFAADTDLSRVSEEYLIFKSLSVLYDSLVGDNRADRASHAGLAEYFDALSAKVAQDEGRQIPAATLWQEQDVGGYSGYEDQANPLAWPGR